MSAIYFSLLAKRLRTVTTLAAGSAASILMLGSAQVSAQGEGAGNLEEIFVTGDRRAYQGNFETLETPLADQFLDNELLRDAGAISLDDALDLSAAVARQNNFGGTWNSFSIRGFAGDINLPSGFLVNGFNAGRGFAGPRDLAGIESVEVLKGPRSALFGRGEPGGTVNLVTKRPNFSDEGELRATIGSWQQLRFEADVQSSFGADDDLGVRLVGFFEDAESFRDTVETERFGLYPSIIWKITDDTRLTYEIEFTQQEVPFDRGVAYTEQFGFTPRKTFVGEPGDGPMETEVFGHQLEVQHNFSDNWSLLGGLGFRDTSFKGSAYEPNFGSRQTLSSDGRTLSRFFRFRDFESDYLVLRAELAGEFNTGSLSHRLLIGADYDRFELSQFILRFRSCRGTAVTANDCLSLDVFNPVYGQYQPLPLAGVNTDREEVLEGAGIYIQDQISITEQFQIRIGGRFDDFEQDLTNLRNTPATTVTTSDTRFSPQFGAVYIFNDGLSAYASYGEGYRQQTGSDFQNNQFDPNITESLEFGIKADVGQFMDNVAGTVTLALFNVEQSNILVNDDRPQATAAGFFSIDAGEARSRGIEIDANLEFGNDASLWLSYAYVDAEFKTSNPDADFGALIEEGDPLINAPEHQLNIQASKGFTIGSMRAQVGGGLQYTDERLGFTGFDFNLPSYTTARLFGELEPTDNITIRLDVDNLFDKTFYTNSFADVWVQPGTPRRFRLTADYRF